MPGSRRAFLTLLPLGALAVVEACGSRTGLLPPPGNGLLYDGGPLDVQIDCASPAYCVASDPGYIYRCGERTFQCSSIEQCEQTSTGAACVNPCLDTLGNDTSNGCEFYAVETDTTEEVMGSCYAVFLVNQWKTGQPARIEVDLAGQMLPVEQFARIPSGKGLDTTYGAYDAAAGLPQNEVAVLFLSRDPQAALDPNPADPRVLASCPPGVTPAVQADASLHGTGTASAFHIKTNVPVVAYQMLPYGGGRARVTGATLLLPTSAWGENYLVADAYAAPLPSMVNGDARAGPTSIFIASQNGTRLTLRPTAAIAPGGGVAGTAAQTPATYTLDQGQYLQITQPAELTGTAVSASAPVGVIGASTLVDLPLMTIRADSAEQMLPPVSALASEYVAVRYRSRTTAYEESVPWRLVGAVDGTVLTFDPPDQPGAPRTLSAQQLAEFDAPGPFVVSSQDSAHPFYLASYMTGGEPFDGTGDPDFVNVVPPAQYLPRYTFFTDPTYPETNLVLVRAKDPSTGVMPDVTLDCAGLVGGWSPVGASGKYEYTRVDLSTGDFQSVGGCSNGVHVITGSPPTAAFGVTVWGWGNDITWPVTGDEDNPLYTGWVSYGYPAGANFAKINSAVLPAE
jgi:hypothetical protein